MAIRFPMSQDTFLKISTSSQSPKQENKKRITCVQEIFFQSEPSQNLPSKDADFQKQSTCNCSNIRVMQLFHEMKQEFPTIPDHIVNEHVINNCHDRENCKVRLQSEINCQIIPLQSYPAQLLRILNKSSMCKKRSQSKSTVPSVDTKNYKNSSDNRNLFKNNLKLFLFNDVVNSAKTNTSNSSEGAQSSAPDIEDMRSGLCNIQIKTYLIDENKLLDVLEQEKETQLPIAPQRPTTLRLSQEPYSREQSKRELSNHLTDKRQSIGKRHSPLSSPNQSQGSTTTPTSTTSSQKFGTTYSTSTSIQSPTNYPDSRKAEISVNVSLSPSSYRHRVGPPQRHQSTINVHPELPFTRNVESFGINQKSYTSVNLVLRQPSSSPQSPIDITVGPNLTYSSSSYHARLGYQNNYHITVTDDGGVFSAFRIHPINYCNPTVRYTDRDGNKEATTNNLQAQSADDYASQNLVAKAPHSKGQSEACEIIMRQHSQMEKLSAVLRKNKNKLELVRKEVKCVMQSSNTDGLSERLDSEIEKLRCDCQTMLNEIEKSRAYGLSEDGIEHTNSIKSRQQQPFPKQKPLRFPPPSISANCTRRHQRSLPFPVVSPRQRSITYHNDDPSDVGVGD